MSINALHRTQITLRFICARELSRYVMKNNAKNMKSSSATRKSSSQQHVDISIWAEVFLMRLLGRPMLYIHGSRNIKTWKRILLRLASAIDKAIKMNVETDGFHVLRLENFSKQLKKACQRKDLSQPEIVLPLVGIIFELLGGTPDYSERPRINRKHDYELFGLRTLEYRQTPYQKMRTILEASRQRPFYDYHRYDDLFEVYVSKFNGKSDEFIQWYKKEYPEVYLQLF